MTPDVTDTPSHNTAIPTYLRERNVTLALWTKQRSLEEESARVGVERFLRGIRKAEEKGRAAVSSPNKALMARVIAPICEMINADMEERRKGKPTRRQSVIRLVFLPGTAKGKSFISPEVAAFVTLRDTFNTLYLRQKAKHLALTIGQSLEDELRWAALDAADHAASVRVREYLKGNTSHHRHRRNALMGFLRHFNVEFAQWSVDKHLQVGRHMMEYLERIGLITINVVQTKRTVRDAYVSATEATREWITNRTQTVLANRPGQMPLVVPPKPWTSTVGGGFWFRGRWGEDIAKAVHIPRAVSPLPLIRGVPGAWMKAVKSETIEAELEGVNALQATPWKVNQKVYSVAITAWRKGMVVASFPSRDKQALPVKPDDIDTNKAALRSWKREARNVYEGNAKTDSQLIAADRTLRLAEKFLEEERFWFAWQCDFRGRKYPVADYLQPQGHDLARGLLCFDRGYALGTQEAADWLAVHVANVWGNDKVSFAERVQWTKDNTPMILAIAEDPLHCLEWVKADKKTRWQFLAACFEWAGYTREGLSFVSHLPIALDATCSGLQHYSAMLRDEVGATATNLLPTDTPNDIYRDVAAETIKLLTAWSEDSGSEGRWARAWIEFGVNRNMTKRPTMTLPYGSTPISCIRYVREAAVERMAAQPFAIDDVEVLVKDRPVKERELAIRFLAKCVWASIGKVVGPAQECMKWIQRAVRAYLKTSPHSAIEWTTPTGFPVRQWYPRLTQRKIKTGYGDSLIEFAVLHESDTADPDGMANGAPPNFVHSLDAAHMTLAVRTLKREGLDHFACIHDSFGTHAAHTAQLVSVLRTELVRLYAENDPLAHLAHKLGFKGPLPATGNMDLPAILKATYSFA